MTQQDAPQPKPVPEQVMDMQAFVQALPQGTMKVPLPNGKVSYVRRLSTGERDRWEALAEKDKGNVRSSLIVLGVCDASGKRVFATGDAAEMQVARNMDGAIGDALFAAIIKHNHMRREDVDEIMGN